MATQIAGHLNAAANGGRIRSIMTVFPPAGPQGLPPYVESPQILQYAGYLHADGRVTGDPQSIQNTRILQSLGWTPPSEPGHFDLLPFVIREPSGRRLFYEVPAGLAHEVPIVHPEFAAIGDLQLRWYGVPVVSDMILTIGGIEYPCAPLNGFYMCTEIASRNLGDERRYNVLPAVAQALGLDSSKAATLWKDRALTELNVAVIHSFDAAGITLVDHHAASEQYMLFQRRERSAGRVPFGRWSWIVPPQASSSCPVFHVSMKDANATPNFYRSRAIDGKTLRPDYTDEDQSRLLSRRLAIRRRMNAWRRAREVG